MFRPVGNRADLWAGEMKGAEVAGRRVLLVNVDGQLRAFEDRCAHKGVPLSQGTLAGRVLTCWAHHWQFDALTGHGINPITAALRPFPIEVRDGQIWVDVDAL